MKIFRSGSSALFRERQQNFNFLPIESHLEIRTSKFCKLYLRQTNSVQSRSLMVYLANTNQTSFVVLVNWHAYYVVNKELICSTLCTLCTMFLCFCLWFFVRFFAFFIVATSFLVNKGKYNRTPEWDCVQWYEGYVCVGYLEHGKCIRDIVGTSDHQRCENASVAHLPPSSSAFEMVYADFCRCEEQYQLIIIIVVAIFVFV